MRWYFEVLHVQPIKVNVTLLPSPGFQEGEISRQYRMASSLGINLLDVTNMPLRINAMMLKNAFMRPKEVMRHISKHIMVQVDSRKYIKQKMSFTLHIFKNKMQFSSGD